MHKIIRLISRPHLLSQSVEFATFSRNVVSQAYWCKEAWAQRLQTTALQAVVLDTYVTRLHEKLDKDGKISALDIDILANRLDEIDLLQLERAQKLFHRFRSSREARFVLPSTHYALIRAFVSLGETERLIEILKDKIGYGIFLDFHSANLLLSHFIEQHKYQDAAHIAYDMMLQEDLGHPLTAALALHACHLHLTHPVTPPASDEAAADAPAEEEVVQVPVAFIENPWYDDHFDIPRDSLLLGKTLLAVGKTLDSVLGRSCQLLGCGLYEKFDAGLAVMDKWLQSGDKLTVAKQAVERFGQVLDQVTVGEAPQQEVEPGTQSLADLYPVVTQALKDKYKLQFQELSEKLTKKGCVVDEDLGGLIKKHLDGVLASGQESKDIEAQSKVFQQWNANRQQLVEEQVRLHRVAQKKASLVTRLKELQATEEKLRYFEHIDKIGLAIAQAAIKVKPVEEKKEEEIFVAAPSERTKGAEKAKAASGKGKGAKA